MSSYIIGTCGHVDHGKTAIIKAINGYEGDTLKEEKDRGITIDLSFSNISQDGKNIAFIDVPGHEKLVKNMISGAFGFDSVMIVVSAAEGIKPQTVEHLEILKLLGVKDAILVISKKDLVPKDELNTKILEIQTFITKYKFNIQGVLPVSIYDEASIDRLKRKLFSLKLKDKEEQNFFRMYIDRTFSIKGKGSIVTGTVLGQALTLRDKLFICDINKAAKIKNIQVHDQDVESANISNRVAMNLANVDSKELKKGFLISKKGYLRGFKTIDIAFSTLGEENMLHHNKNYIIYIGSRRVEAKINLIGTDYPIPEGFATIKASSDIFSIYGEKLIIRDSNKTVAGGVVLNPISDPLKKRQRLELLNALEERDFAKAYIVLLEAHKKGLGLVSSAQRFALSHEEALNEAKALEGCFIDEKALIIYPLASQIIIIDAIRAIYEKNPYALLSVSSIKLRLVWASDAFIQAAIDFLVEDGLLIKEKNLYKNSNVKEDISDVLESRILKMLEDEDVAPTAPYNIYDSLDLDRKSGDDILKALCRRKEVVRIEHNIFMHAKSLTKLMTHMKEIIKLEGHIDLKILKEHYPLSRKYLIAYLDYLDKFSDIMNEKGKRFFVHQ
ncbi:Selenocysteine-specific translation elongation factor [hydrothermal vent metagenome]|uniref:Selenocysteine-specific translation elongation factor n=1 Tax=hydrothermal vent metagenome TaxID=652676 RepID=A0A1W1EFU8_9ZZZZ